MSHIDIINLYNDYIGLGKSKEEATLLIKSLDVNTMDFVTKSELSHTLSEFKNEIRSDFHEIKIDLKSIKTNMKWYWVILTFIGAVCVVPFILSIHIWWKNFI